MKYKDASKVNENLRNIAIKAETSLNISIQKNRHYLTQQVPMLYYDDLVLGIKKSGEYSIYKNRFLVNDLYKIDDKILIELLSSVLVKNFLNNSMTIFEDDLIDKLQIQIKQFFETIIIKEKE